MLVSSDCLHLLYAWLINVISVLCFHRGTSPYASEFFMYFRLEILNASNLNRRLFHYLLIKMPSQSAIEFLELNVFYVAHIMLYIVNM